MTVAAARLVDSGGNAVDVEVALAPHPTCPLSVVLGIVHDGQVVPWTFGRTILASGQRERAGIGDVCVHPAGDGVHVCVHLENGEDEARVSIPLVAVREALAECRRRTPPSRERRIIAAQIDDAIARCLA
jgi:hypothetical protein